MRYGVETTVCAERRVPSPVAVALRARLTALTLLLRREMSDRLAVSVVQAQVLRILATEGPQRLVDLVREQGTSQPSMTVLVDRLERRGWAQRHADPADRRAVRVSITPAGVRVLDEVVAARTELLGRRLAALSAADRHAIEAALPALERLEDQWRAELADEQSSRRKEDRAS
ncbi:MAG: MarR family winged helix-turn-helix transcriptional regulator [Acidimicrobiales bacterium]